MTPTPPDVHRSRLRVRRRTPHGQVGEERRRLRPGVRGGPVLGFVDRPPDPLGSERHVDVAHPQRGEGVDDGVLHRGRRTDRGRLADPLRAERVVRRRCLGARRPRRSGARPRWAARSRRRCPTSGCRRRRRTNPSHSACEMPCASPPCCWPATSVGLSTVPQSSTATWRTGVTRPVSRSTSTTDDVRTEGVRRAGLALVAGLGQRHALLGRGGRDLAPREHAVGHAGDAQADDAVVVDRDVAGIGLQRRGDDLARPGQHGVGRDEHARARRAAASASRPSRRRGVRRRCRTARSAPGPSGRRDGRRRSSRTTSRGPGRAPEVPTDTVAPPSSSTLTAPYSAPPPPR